jgi:hypothetical protein
MSNRPLVLLAGAITVAGLFFWQRSVTQAQITSPQPAPAADELQAVTLIFGSKDPEPAKWDGSATLSRGSIERIRGHHFTAEAKIVGKDSWTCSTHAWGAFSGGMHPDERPQPQPTPNEAVGVTIEFRAPADAELRIKVPKGDFSFRPLDIPPDGGIFPLNATVEVYRTPPVSSLTDAAFENDYPSLAADGKNVWLAWQGYQKDSEQIFLRRYTGGQWSEPLTVTEKPGDLFMTGIVAAGGKPTVVWSAHEGDDWNLKARTWDGSAFGKIENVTTTGHNLFHRVAADAAGNIHVAYQSARKGRSDIWLRSKVGGKWLPEINLSDAQRDRRANDWNPAVAVDRKGTVWVAWDSYTTGSYNIYMRAVRDGKAAPELIPVTTSTRFHAHPSLAVDREDRVWVAYDEAPENWGKDVGFLLKGGTGLYESRTIKVAVYGGGRWMTPLSQPGDVAPWGFKRYVQTPHLVADSAGRMWLFARPRTSARLPTSLWAAGGKWEVVATHYSGDRWSELQLIPESVGRNEGPLEAAADASGNVYLALVSDQRNWGGAAFGGNPVNNAVQFARLRSEQLGGLKIASRPAEPPAAGNPEPQEKQQVAGMRGIAVQNGGKTYHVYRGDMHRHTDISADGAGDGDVWDAYRYMMDAAAMDWFVLTDHQSGGQDYTWWRTQKAVNMFHVPGFFTALYGTERSLSYPNGHRNLVFAQATKLLPITPQEQKSSTGPVLYPYLRENKGLASSHTSHTNMGTDWRDNDPDLEPIVEIYQGARTSAEHEGAPLSPTEKRTELHAGGYRPLGYVWNAWAKGYKLGVQASSDHVSTHLSYACVIAENSSREALMDAMRKRHTYAATSNILMDYRMTSGSETHIQGDIFESGALPELSAKIVGTGPLKKVVIVRDNQYIFSNEPEGSTFQLRFKENSLSPGEHYYYVRAEQKNGNMAWSSPIWIKYK